MEYTKGPYCNNCGNVGHLYRNCLHPILSYGIILYKEVSDNEYELLMVERKNSISYIEFLRGKYKDIHNIEYIELLCSRFSSEEKIKILQHSFDELWKDLWIHVETINPRIKKEYEKSKQMFSILQDGYLSDKQEYSLHSFIGNVSTTYQHNEWEIPKGRRSNRETNRNCAIREFEEETNISRDKYQLFDNIIPITEDYYGINNVHYKHVYYLGKLFQSCELYIDSDKKEQYTEIKTLKWMKKEDLSHHIRDHDKLKKKILLDLFDFLESHKDKILIK